MPKNKLLGGIYRALMRISSERHPPFRINSSVKDQTFVRAGPKKITTVDEARVVNVAHQLEAVIVMAEMLEGEHPVALAVTNLELAHFVAYVRQLDDAYRTQVQKVERLESQNKELLEKAGVISK